MKEAKLRTPIQVFDELDQLFINVHIDLCLIEALRFHCGTVPGFDDNSIQTAMDWSLARLQGYFDTLSACFDYCRSFDYVAQRYMELTGSVSASPFRSSD